jgi:hypothetical protein
MYSRKELLFKGGNVLWKEWDLAVTYFILEKIEKLFAQYSIS